MPRSLLIFAHPDDETVALGARLARFNGACIVHVTDGAPRNEEDSRAHGFETLDDYRHARRMELRRALKAGGVRQPRLVELNYPDQEASFHLEAMTHRICSLLAEQGPEVVFTHPYEGGHPDHDACAFAVHQAVRLHHRMTGQSAVIIEAAFYHAGPAGIVTGSFLRRTDGIQEVECPLSPEERHRKKAMLISFPTQRETLAQFHLVSERFRIAPDYVFSRPPHPGQLFYEGFPWGMQGQQFCELARDAMDSLQETGEAACR